ncbi:MAG: hypothetical protein GY882_00215 [Actinomycetia bacterium]|nr:hypothetical protein [Actinomycetes bacterium]MCP4846157.1 hypothetical protein [Actinomycetes bacterium]
MEPRHRPGRLAPLADNADFKALRRQASPFAPLAVELCGRLSLELTDGGWVFAAGGGGERPSAFEALLGYFAACPAADTREAQVVRTLFSNRHAVDHLVDAGNDCSDVLATFQSMATASDAPSKEAIWMAILEDPANAPARAAAVVRHLGAVRTAQPGGPGRVQSGLWQS